MDKRIIVSILFVAALAYVAAQWIPAPAASADTLSKRQAQFLPWQIESSANRSIRVFGIVLGQTRLREAEALYQTPAEVSLFVSTQGQYQVEAYFDKLILGGFSAQMVMSMDLSQTQQAAMFKRGLRLSHLGGGRQKVSLTEDDRRQVANAAINSLVYLTRTRVDESLLLKRFGEPTRRVREKKQHLTHWFYPDKGLDVALGDQGHAVFQYISPQHFSLLQAPLTQQQESQGR